MPPKKLFFLRAGFHGKKNNLDKTMRDILNETYLHGIELSDCVVFHDTFDVDRLNQFEIPKKFRGISRLTYFCSSLGDRLDKKIDDYQKNGEILRASLLDAWGSEAVEEINEQFDKSLREMYGNGTMRFSPGYDEISLMENIKILNLLDVKGISSHHKSGVLMPQKSTVCMIGWYSNTLEENNDK